MFPRIPLVRFRLASVRSASSGKSLKELKFTDLRKQGGVPFMRFMAVYGFCDGVVFLSGMMMLKDYADAYTCYKIISKPAQVVANLLSENENEECLTKEEFNSKYIDPFMERARKMLPKKTLDYLIAAAIMIGLKQVYRMGNLVLAYHIYESKSFNRVFPKNVKYAAFRPWVLVLVPLTMLFSITHDFL